MSNELTLRIILEKPTAAVDFGIQKGKGNNYETILKQRSVGKDLRFEFTITVKPGKDGLYDLFGTIVQGTAGDRFIYIDIGTYARQQDTPWSRRLKIPLKGITETMINHLLAHPKIIMETNIAGRGNDNSPACGTAKPFNGWRLSK